MNDIMTEKQYQRYIIERLTQENQYIERKNTDFDHIYALDRGMLFKFLEDTKLDTTAALRKLYKAVTVETLKKEVC